MIAFVLRRLLWTTVVLFGVSVVVFFTVKLVPGDPVAAMAGPGASPQALAGLKARLGMDHSLPVQYGHWLGHALTGDLGRSIAHHQTAAPLVRDALANTLILAGIATGIAVAVGTAMGAVSAVRPRSLLGRITAGTSVAAVAMPQYSVALVLVAYVALRTGWFPVSGMHTVGSSSLLDLLRHAFLPAMTAALVAAGMIARQFRVSLAEVLEQDFVASLRARGLSRRRVLMHAMHSALPSLLTIVGLQLSYLIGGLVFVEAVFSWPGLGLLLYQSISSRDLPVVQAGVLACAILLVLANIIVDTVHAAIDPRVRKA
ncbi:ABC transporter permease [Streptomyces sp. NBC_01643]|uniref:ABC transporter permease n=1 Tax=Streptomyces sp. NBC_01643 TaxID=2975906 RepID=UPI002F91746B|nr:ABC transporter permease [Streptomyces sp. NBC_01643]